MLWPAVSCWVALVPLMVMNGAFRDFVMTPRLGDPVARALSCFTGSALIFAVAWVFVRWQGPLDTGAALAVGALWLALTIAFEFGLGRATGKSWAVLLEDYDVTKGRLWILVLLSVATAPWVWSRIVA